MSEQGDRILAIIRQRARHGRGRGINAKQYIARKYAILTRILALLDRGPRWGELSQLQRDMRARYRVSSSEFYELHRIAKRFLPQLRTARAAAVEWQVAEEHITAGEMHRWRDRSADAVLRLARWRARRKNSPTFLE